MPKVPVGVDAKGLAVAPGFIDAHTHDDLASLTRGTGALYATHMRDEGLGLLDSVSEAIEIGERAWGLVKKIARPHRSRPSERRKRPHRPAPLHGGQFA